MSTHERNISELSRHPLLLPDSFCAVSNKYIQLAYPVHIDVTAFHINWAKQEFTESVGTHNHSHYGNTQSSKVSFWYSEDFIITLVSLIMVQHCITFSVSLDMISNCVILKGKCIGCFNKYPHCMFESEIRKIYLILFR